MCESFPTRSEFRPWLIAAAEALGITVKGRVYADELETHGPGHLARNAKIDAEMVRRFNPHHRNARNFRKLTLFARRIARSVV